MMTLSPQFTYAFLLLLIRTSTMLVSAPLLGHKGIPSWTKVGFAVFIALVLVPTESKRLPEAPQDFGTVAAAVIVGIAARGVGPIVVLQPFVQRARPVHKVANRGCRQFLIGNKVAICAQAELQGGAQPADRAVILSVG